MAKAQRELDRERTKLEQQEKKLVADIKRSAKSGQLVRFSDPSRSSVRTHLTGDIMLPSLYALLYDCLGLFRFPVYRCIWSNPTGEFEVECMQGYGERSRPDEEIRPEVLSDENTAASCRTAHTDSEE